jgi:GTP cyclohydrolase FolE2
MLLIPETQGINMSRAVNAISAANQDCDALAHQTGRPEREVDVKCRI